MKLAGFEGTLSKSCWSNYQVESSRYSRGVFVLLPNAKDCASTSLYHERHEHGRATTSHADTGRRTGSLHEDSKHKSTSVKISECLRLWASEHASIHLPSKL